MPVASSFALSRSGAGYGFPLTADTTAGTRSSSTQASSIRDYLGGSSDDSGEGIAVDGAGSAFVTGVTASATSRRPRAPSTPTLDGSEDAFVTKLDPSGAGLVYSTYLGGSGSEWGNGIAVDGSGSAYVTGSRPRPTSRPPRAPSTRPSTAARTTSS